ncbi:MAG: hypothetical protein QM635_05655 [Microbacteriaceae bacterium]
MSALGDRVRFSAEAAGYLRRLAGGSGVEGIVFRLSSPPAGCEGQLCEGRFDSAARPHDIVETVDELTVVIDPGSLGRIGPVLVDLVPLDSGAALAFRPDPTRPRAAQPGVASPDTAG